MHDAVGRPTRLGAPRVSRSQIIQWSMYFLTVLLIVGPLLPLIYQAFTDRPLYDVGEQYTLQNFSDVFSSSQFGTAARNSLIYAFLATLFSQLIGALQAVLVARTNMPGRRLLGLVVLCPLFISPLVIAFGWHVLYGSAGYVSSLARNTFGVVPWNLQSLLGMSLIGGVLNAPIAFLYCRGAIALSDQSMEDAARICGAPPITIIRRITIPLLGPAVVFSGMINFTNALETLSIPLIFGEPAGISLLMPLLYKQAFGLTTANYGVVAAASLLLLAVVTLLLYVQSRILGDTQRFRSVSGKATRKSLFDIGRLRWPAAIVFGATTCAFIVFPMAAILMRSFVTVLTPLIPVWDVLTLDHYSRFWMSANLQRATLNSVILAGFGGAIAVGFATLVALVAYRSEFRFKTQLEYIAMIPRAVPGMIAGIAFLYTILLLPGIGPLRSTLVIFMVAYTARFLPSALGALYPTFAQIGQDLDRSARTMGADWWTSSVRILVPLMMPAMLSAYVLIFVQTMREYSMALFLVAPGSEVLSIALLQAWTQGDLGVVSALSVVQSLIIAVFITVASLVFRTKITA